MGVDAQDQDAVNSLYAGEIAAKCAAGWWGNLQWHYQNTGIFLLKYLGRPDGGKVLNKTKTAYDVLGVPERIQLTESMKYLPIPQDEIEAAKGTLKQNEY